MTRSLLDLADRLGAQAHVPGDAIISGFATDSNAVRPGDLFLAIRGNRVDGHDYAAKAREFGATAVLAERPVEAPYLLVPNLVEALASMARSFRTSFDGPVIGVTGSAGKTTTKEFLAAALSPLGDVLKTEGNRNTEYTAPLLWAELEPTHVAAVVEMAMRGFGQIRHLASFGMPTVGIVTNIGFSHLEQVGSREGIADAKGELLEALPENGLAILWQEDEFLSVLKKKTSARTLTFGYSESADCQITRYTPIDWTTCAVHGHCSGQAWEARLPAVGKHIALNAAAAILAASRCGVDAVVAAAALELSSLPPLRMEVVRRNEVNILLDTYNASPPSMIAAIETLAELPTNGQRKAVVGEMKELGAHRETAHRSVGEALARTGIDQVILYGESTRYVEEAALQSGMKPEKILRAESLQDITAFLDACLPGDSVLVKGSRALELERAISNS